ncbi:small glutamine-rich tetratricopeptide repeat-containing protein 2-like [Rutidosis leptorrhynchoides]|uniref:small glutamine-rich tetratricopeptide repeat-containing protein 2-like n=1 Tax=Rutidosis leptorrhynchoides TaxID=125765 RepID=UPI003A997AEA
MEKKLYTDAIGHYTAAIALFEDNAVYYCNRAAAYTQVKQYMEAIGDCHKAVVIDPSYNKAYSRLGFAYHAQGNYMDAIEKGYKKGLYISFKL